MSVQKLLFVTFLIVSLGACQRFGTGVTSQARVVSNPVETTATALSAIDLKGFLEPQVAETLTENEMAEATSAQFYALQFGRPGAPRSWQGSSGNSGKVTVGPYVRVNQLDCRDFSHEVKTTKGTFTKSGTACRESNGGWSVV